MKSAVFAAALAVSAMVAGAAAAADQAVTYLFPAPEFLPAFAPFQLAQGKGYFKDAGLDVTFRAGKGGADVATQVAVGNADLGGGMGDTTIVVRPNGLEVRGVALLGGRGLTQLAWRTDRGIAGLADLKGKKIGVITYQDTAYYNLLGALASVGLTKNDVNIQAVGAGGLIQLTASGELDGFSGVPEWIAAVEEMGVDLDHMPADKAFPGMAQAIIASDKTIAERPEMVRGFVGAVMKAIEDIQTDPAKAAAEFVRFVPQHTGKEAQIEAIMRSYASNVYPAQDGVPMGAFDPARIEAAQKFYVEHDIVPRAVPVADLYNNEFVK